jgi:hypothetical protein
MRHRRGILRYKPLSQRELPHRHSEANSIRCKCEQAHPESVFVVNLNCEKHCQQYVDTPEHPDRSAVEPLDVSGEGIREA